MQLTKYKHACLTIDIDGKRLVIDPGVLSPDFAVTENILAIIVTHAHPDHFSAETLAAIYEKNPDSMLISTAEVIGQLPDHTSHAARAGEHIDIGPFHLDFYGGQHAAIHTSVPVIDNIGVMVNDKLYYPGDSFHLPEVAVDTLAVPVGAPWLKSAEAIDFLVNVKPRFAFPTHDETLSSDGKGFSSAWLERFANEHAIEYKDISGQTITLA